MNLKLVRIRQKHFKRNQVINPGKVRILQKFLKDIIKDETLIINTNFGLDVYYLSDLDCTDIIVSAFHIMANEEPNHQVKYPVNSYNSVEEIEEVVFMSLMQLSAVHHTFINYSKSFLKQINDNLKESRTIIKCLLQMSDKALETLFKKDKYNTRLQGFKRDFEVLFKESPLDPIVKDLVKKALNQDRLN